VGALFDCWPPGIVAMHLKNFTGRRFLGSQAGKTTTSGFTCNPRRGPSLRSSTYLHRRVVPFICPQCCRNEILFRGFTLFPFCTLLPSRHLRGVCFEKKKWPPIPEFSDLGESYGSSFGSVTHHGSHTNYKTKSFHGFI